MKRAGSERWFDDDCSRRAELAFDAVSRARQRDARRRYRMLSHACLYGDGATVQLSMVASDFGPPSLQFNVVRRTIDTTASKVATARPLPMALTSGGDFRQRRRAQKLSQFFAGMFDDLSVFEVSELVARDALIFGTGISHTFRDGDKIRHERVLPWDVDVDPGEARYGNPRCLYRHQWRDRAELAAEYPKSEAAIYAGTSTVFRDDPFRDRDSHLRGMVDEQIPLLEAWCLPIGEEGDEDFVPGRHLLCVPGVGEDAVLVDEEYVAPEFPFAFLHCARPLFGFWGDGFAHALEGMQAELCRVAMRVQENHYMTGTYVSVDASSGLNVSHINNGALTILEDSGAGRPPQFFAPNANSAQTLGYLENLRGSWPFEETGVGAMASNAEVPVGMSGASGTALRTIAAVEDKRHALFVRQFERYHIVISWQIYRLSCEIAEGKGKVEARAVYRRRVDKIAWKDVAIDRKDLVLQVFPTNALSQDPAARRAEVAEWVNSGFIPPDMARGLLQIPDLEEFSSVEGAPRDLIEDVVWRLLDAEVDEETGEPAPGVYVAPEPPWDLALCVRLGSLLRARAWLDGAPQENLDLVMRFITDAQNLLNEANPPPPPPPAGAPPMPPPPLEEVA